jgi:hypothetical protein
LLAKLPQLESFVWEPSRLHWGNYHPIPHGKQSWSRTKGYETYGEGAAAVLSPFSWRLIEFVSSFGTGLPPKLKDLLFFFRRLQRRICLWCWPAIPPRSYLSHGRSWSCRSTRTRKFRTYTASCPIHDRCLGLLQGLPERLCMAALRIDKSDFRLACSLFEQR